MLLLKPTGRFSVGIQDISYCTADSASKIAADNHVVGRVFYPAKSSGWLSRPLTWIRDYHYAQGYVSWGLRNPSTIKEKLLKAAASSTIFAIGSAKILQGSYNAVPEDSKGAFPVIVFSHGAASMRNTYSILCSEFASRLAKDLQHPDRHPQMAIAGCLQGHFQALQGFVVASVEHADGTACCAQLATGEWKFLQGLGTGQVLEAKCDYRVQECLTMAQVLQSMNAGASIGGVKLSGPVSACSAFKGLLDMRRLAVMGHSCGGATAAAVVAAHAEFKCGVALDPWWPLLPSESAALKGWQTNSPLLVLGSQDWNIPETMWCDGPRQQAVFKAALPRMNSSSSSSAKSSTSSSSPQAMARTPVVAASAAYSNGSYLDGSSNGSGTGSEGPSGSSSSRVGGGVIHVVPRGSKHASFTDLPFLVPAWLAIKLRQMTGAKAANTAGEVDASVIHDVICWSTHTFLQDHLPLPKSSAASLFRQEEWQRQQQQGTSPALQPATAAAAAGSAVSAPAGPWPGDGDGDAAAAAVAAGNESLVDHLAADENLMVADEKVTAGGRGVGSSNTAGVYGAAIPVAHAAEHDQSLERVSSAELEAAAEQKHVPVQQAEEENYKQWLHDTAYLVKVHTC